MIHPHPARRRRTAAVLALAVSAAGTILGLHPAVRRAAAAPTYESHLPRILLTAQSEAVVGEAVRVAVLVSARWGREGPEVPTAGVDADVSLDVTTTDPAASFPATTVANGGSTTFDVVFRTPGLHRLRASSPDAAPGESAPVRVTESAPAQRVYWGDLHGHLHTPGAGHAGRLPPGEYARFLREGFAFARDRALLDFAAFSPHLQTAGGLVRPDAAGVTPWSELLAAVDEWHAPGRFVVFPAFEWQGDAGDHVVVYPRPGPLDAPADFPALCRSVLERGALLHAHAVVLPSEFTFRTPALTGIEVTRDSHDTEWLGIRALERGVVAAFLGCSDTHGGALGATSLTGLRAPELTRDAVMDAIRRRRTWATNGERIVLDVTVDGSPDAPRLVVSGVGTAPVDVIEVLRDGKVVARGRNQGTPPEFRFEWEDDGLPPAGEGSARVAYHVRVVQASWNRYDPSRRDVAISSPVVVERAGGTGGDVRGEEAAVEPHPGETRRGRELREAFERAWGYTSPGASRPLVEPRGPWRRECGTVVPGHAVARSRGFGALADGRAVVALADTLLVVDPATGTVRAVAYPGGHRMEAGREFCVADLGEGGAVVRGADGPDGGWAAVLDVASGTWSDAPNRAEEGTIVVDGTGAVASLVGRSLRRATGPRRMDSTGRLLAVSASGEAVVRLAQGGAVRLEADGRIRQRITGQVLAAAPDGSALILAGLNARHPELATGIELSLQRPDGTTAGPFPLDVRASPVLDPPVAAAFTPDGALLLLGGADTWRREPGHDWWGASVERWLPLDGR